MTVETLQGYSGHETLARRVERLERERVRHAADPKPQGDISVSATGDVIADED